MSHYHQHTGVPAGIIKSAVHVLWSWSEVTLDHSGVFHISEQRVVVPTPHLPLPGGLWGAAVIGASVMLRVTVPWAGGASKDQNSLVHVQRTSCELIKECFEIKSQTSCFFLLSCVIPGIDSYLPYGEFAFTPGSSHVSGCCVGTTEDIAGN